MNKQTVVSVRLVTDDLRKLQILAQVEGVSVGEIIRNAVTKELALHLSSKEFRKKARELVKRNQEALDEILNG